MKTLYLVDSSIYIFRAWHTLPAGITTTKNEPANAVYGFTEFLLHLLENEKPTHMVCAFDESHEHSIRKKIFPDYKSNRPAAPPDLQKQFDWCKEFAASMGISCFSNERLEADDIIGTLAGYSQDQNHRSIIVSADKDLAQFIGENDILWDFARRKRLSVQDIRKRFQLSPHQIADMLALAGDKVDNIPGVPGVGLNTAARLLMKWGNLDNLFANIEKAESMKFRGAKRTAQAVEEHKETVYLSRRLTGLYRDESLPRDFEALKLQSANMNKLEELFGCFQFTADRRRRWLQILQKSA